MSDTTYGPYVLCGWKILSTLPLPELSPWNGPDGAEVIWIDACPGTPTRCVDDTWFEVRTDGSVRINAGVSASFLVMLRQVEVRYSPEMDLLLLRQCLYGSVVAALCFQRGLLPLHGSCVQVGDGAVIFSGDSGAGKSTLATAMTQRGHRLISDDVCAMDVLGERPTVRFALGRAKLLPDAAAALHLTGDPSKNFTMHADKFHLGLPCIGAAASGPFPVSAIYMLQRPFVEGLRMERMSGSAAVFALQSQVHRSAMGNAMGLVQRIFQTVHALAMRVPVYALYRPCDLSALAATADVIAERHGAHTMSDTRMFAGSAP